MKKGEYLESIGLMTFANHQFLQGNADENYKKWQKDWQKTLLRFGMKTKIERCVT